MKDDLFKTGYSIITNIDKTSEALYQRKVEADGMLQIVIKQITLFSQLIMDGENQFGEELLLKWASSNNLLMDAVYKQDIVLIADVLHFEVRPVMKAFIE